MPHSNGSNGRGGEERVWDDNKDDDVDIFHTKTTVPHAPPPRVRSSRRWRNDDDDASSSSSHSNTNQKATRNRRQKDKALYGVFAASSSGSDDDETGPSKRRRDHRRRRDPSSAMTGAPIFVTGEIKAAPPPDPTTNNNSNNNNNNKNWNETTAANISETTTSTQSQDPQQLYSNNSSSSSNNQCSVVHDIEEQQHQQEDEQRTQAAAEEKEDDEANLKFLALLQQGKGKRLATRGGTSSSNNNNDDKVNMEGNNNNNNNSFQMPAMAALCKQPTLKQPLRRHHHHHHQLQQHATTAAVGTWERHTKGIGMKLLTKMGYSGSGGLVGGRQKRRHQQQKEQQATGSEQEQQGKTNTNSASIPVNNNIYKPTADLEEEIITTGIAAPVPVKVRPANLGLGYGSFREATSSSPSSRAVATTKTDDRRKNDSSAAATSSTHQQGTASYAPKPWKRRRRSKENDATTNEQALESVKIVDMRGPSSVNDNSNEEFLVAEELLHNVGISQSQCELRMQTADFWTRSHQRQAESLQAEVAALALQQKTAQDQERKLTRVLPLLDEMETIINSYNTLSDAASWTLQNSTDVDSQKDAETSSHLNDTLSKMHDLVQRLMTTFTKAEREQLKFSSTLIPSLLGTVVQSALSAAWNPKLLPNDNSPSTKCVTPESSQRWIRSILFIPDEASVTFSDEMAEIQKSILIQYVIPALRLFLESSRWNPITDHNHVGLHLYESLESVVQQEFEPPISSSNEEQQPRSEREPMLIDTKEVFPFGHIIDDSRATSLVALLRKSIVESVVFPRLSRALVSAWKPQVHSGKLVNRPDLWVFPWLPHVSNDIANMTTLVSDCKRAIQSAVSFLAQNVGDEQLFLLSCVETIRPWKGVFKETTIEGVMLTSVIPRLARFLNQYSIDVKQNDGHEKLWLVMNEMFRMHKLELLSDLCMICLLEGELLPNWANTVHQWIVAARSKPMQHEDFKGGLYKMYATWKGKIFDRADPIDGIFYQNARGDVGLCSCFYAVLLMLQLHFSQERTLASDTLLNGLGVLSGASNYRLALKKRKSENKQRLTTTESDQQHHVSTQSSRGGCANHEHALTFRDVVGEYARERDIVFKPRMGETATVDGKQIFLFGGVPIYLDGNVAFASEGSGVWKPMSLDEIAIKATR